VARSPVLFFDQTPAGRLLNRFSKDADDMDSLLPQAINEFGNCLMTIVATLIFEAVVQPYFLVGAIPALALYYWVQRFYRASYVECQRTDAVTRSPIFSNLSQAVAGVDTIRADAAGPAAFAARSDALVDANNTAFFSVRSSEQWLSLRLEVLSACLVCLVAALATATAGRIPPSLAALALSEALDLTGFLKYWVNAAAGLENRLNSVERLRAVTVLPPEAADERGGDAALAAAGWPTRGALEFSDVWLTYRVGLDPALRGVTFDVPAGAKVGVCGRTGSGKSSLVVALYRLTEPSSGRVAVDGVDLASVGLATLRQRLGCIPQDPILFSGTVRYNLDPYDAHDDAAVWAALEVVSLKDVVREGPLGLSEKVVEGGDNWSVGQRQLLCVARAVLRGSKLLVADEATASVDAESDAAIQRALRVAFAGATVLTVAHRVSTILDSDLIIVMDAGVVGEVGSVDELLGREGGAFRALVEGAGH
jgi:ABC-type multidrug transport system fused ATPase/permease subunit